MTPFENLPPRLRRRWKRSRANLLAAIAECFGPDSPLLLLFSDNSELSAEQLADKILDGNVKLPDVQLTPEQQQLFGFQDCPPDRTLLAPPGGVTA